LSKSRSFGRAASPGRGYPAATTLCPGYTSAKAADEPKRNISSKAFNGLHDISKLAVTFFSTRKGTHTQLPFYPLLSFVAEGPFQVAYDSPVRVKKQLEEWWDISASHFSSVIYRTERPGKFCFCSEPIGQGHPIFSSRRFEGGPATDSVGRTCFTWLPRCLRPRADHEMTSANRALWSSTTSVSSIVFM
jgi:hypothetical protein